MTRRRVGITAALMHPDKNRNLFRPKTIIYSEMQMYHWLIANDLIPVMIPPITEYIEAVLDDVEGVIVFGGADVAPQSYGEVPLQPEWLGDAERDNYEIEVIKTCLERKIPLFGICRGMQILNVAMGGTLYQDISLQTDSTFIHRDVEIYDRNYHEIEIQPGGFMDRLYINSETKRVNTIHHQAIKDLASELKVEATCIEDNIIEAVSHRDPTMPVFAVQWHPEWLAFDETKTLDPDRLLLHLKQKMDEAHR